MIEEGPGESSRWTRQRRGHTLHADSDEHVRLVVRTLGIEESAWAETLDRYAESVNPGASVDDRLRTLSDAFRPASTQTAPLPESSASACPACQALALLPCIARRAGPDGATLLYGRCAACGHGALLSGASPATIYQSAAYYRGRQLDGSGYAAYAAERSYREAKGSSLLAWLAPIFGSLKASPSLLEVGSGFGFTRRAAELCGYRTGGVDLNPFAAQTARELYGFQTITGTLGAALDRGEVDKQAWNVVLYQFVLEHVFDPGLELARAAEAAAPGGYVVVVSPNMASFELEVFGASYRSLRADHFHLFSVASARAYARAAGLTEVAHKTSCSLQLLRGFLTQAELDQLYLGDSGPDLSFVAKSRS